MVFNAMDRRVESRFGDMGMRIIAGSPMYVGDFLERKALEVHTEQNERAHVIRRPIWDRHYPLWFRQKRPVFHVNIENFEIVENPLKYEPPNDKWIKVPKTPEYLRAFKSNPEGALRDLAAIPSAAIVRFFENLELIAKYANKKRKHPVDRDENFHPDFKGKPETFYALHIDMSIGGKQYKRLDVVEIGSTKDRKHDACGMAMGHIKGHNGEGLPITCIDFMHAIQGKLQRTGPGGQWERGAIRMEEILGWVDALLERGFTITTATLDGFQSAHLMQQLLDRGIDVRYLSVDRNMAPYIDMKEALLSERLDYYPHKKFLTELTTLEKVGGKKIDHAPGGSKDVSDCVAGVVHTLTVLHGGQIPQDFEVKIY
jgi:hypothetical protein